MSAGRTPPAGLPLVRRLSISAASALAVFAAAAILSALAGLWVFNAPGPPAAREGRTTVILPRGAGLAEIGSSLQQAGVVRSAATFEAAAEISGAGRHLKAGEYAFVSRASIGQIIDAIRNGRVVRHLVTVPEGATSQAVVDILMAHVELRGSAAVPPEGAVLPETYEALLGDDRAAVLKRMMDAQIRLMADLWRKRRPDLAFTDPRQAVILASIVEKETALANERPLVAAVFLNRLAKGMRLESDPTVIYGLNGGRPLGRGLRESELMQTNPYNTYRIDGLPPGPICNPGRASLAAVLDPARTDALYFVANGQGGHAFAATLADHLVNVEKWRRIEGDRVGRAQAEAAHAENRRATP